MLSPEASAEPGRWRTDRAPYQREMLDTLDDPTVETVVFKTSSQVGKTEILNNLVGFFVHLDPGPMMVVQPTIEMAGAWSTDRLEPMCRDTPALAERVARGRSKDGRARKLQKTFPGGHVTIVGANAPAGLASRPIQRLLCDEVDRFPLSAGKEGDPVALAKARTITFHDRKILLVSTPTDSDFSRIQDEWNLSDQRFYMVPCPECGTFQRLVWKQVKFRNHDPDTTVYECEHCQAALREHHKADMLAGGYWEATKKSSVPGFHLSELYSPWGQWARVVAKFLAAKDDPAKLQVWTNTSLGEVWDNGERVQSSTLIERAEDYELAPEGVLYLTMGVDVQDDRLEALVCGWGVGDEMWALEHKVIYGHPEDEKDPCWASLEEFRRARRPSARGNEMRIASTCVDSGYLTDSVYAYCRPRYNDRTFATKGVAGGDIPVVYRRARRRKEPTKCPVFSIGVDSAKDLLFRRLPKAEAGPGALHFRKAFGREFFEQVTSEVRRVEYSMGKARVRYVKIRQRNEALDLLVYNLAALLIERPLLLGPVHTPPGEQGELKLDEGAVEELEAKPRRKASKWGKWSKR